jgi:hypothetical protein
MHGKGPGVILMTTGAIVALVGLGIVAVRVLEIPRHWVPLLVGMALFLIGAIRWVTARGNRE